MKDTDNSYFIAIAVGQGDAFFLQKGDYSVLVDGGRAEQGYPNQFQRVTTQNGVTIIACTHNDADHALGPMIMEGIYPEEFRGQDT